MIYRLLTLLTLAITLSACSKTEAPAPTVPAQQATSPSKGGEITKENQGVLTDTEAKGLNEANGVSAALKDAEEARRKQLEAAEGK